ncbi:hypothetical protein OGH69_16160 [Flavobacterium sp. MFBS3-15]|uniref:hypothetical protein n=1 Tax=Flavobacterium sp. MFBS3-15 TaxID=2989816 RepID=UPI002236A1C2|nr:hypothetical protein [Flavobacterium sp. MFBS3-15]MCW4470506.1 hypothetical protein [Flavobacterium sp. MFBS3-15]
MKKMFIFIGCAALTATAVIVGCSDEKEVNLAEPASRVAVSAENAKGEVPRDRLIYSVLTKSAEYSVSELEAEYRKDIGSARPDYMTNLKNMWMIIINPRVYNEGTEEQKLFFINEQLALEDNLAHFAGFYNLLISSKTLEPAEKERIANEFYDKNHKVIAEAQWPDAKDGKKKESELAYAKRTYHMLLKTQK